MRTRHFSLVFAPLVLAACAGARAPGPTTVTAADVEAPSSSSPSPVAPVAASAPTIAAAKEAAPEQDRAACRIKRSGGGTTELVLEWSGEQAKGVLRTVAASGAVTLVKVRAERHKGMIVADDINATDLVDHAALVRKQDGKLYMLLGDHEQIWSACDTSD